MSSICVLLLVGKLLSPFQGGVEENARDGCWSRISQAVKVLMWRSSASAASSSVACWLQDKLFIQYSPYLMKLCGVEDTSTQHNTIQSTVSSILRRRGHWRRTRCWWWSRVWQWISHSCTASMKPIYRAKGEEEEKSLNRNQRERQELSLSPHTTLWQTTEIQPNIALSGCGWW